MGDCVGNGSAGGDPELGTGGAGGDPELAMGVQVGQDREVAAGGWGGSGEGLGVPWGPRPCPCPGRNLEEKRLLWRLLDVPGAPGQGGEAGARSGGSGQGRSWTPAAQPDPVCVPGRLRAALCQLGAAVWAQQAQPGGSAVQQRGQYPVGRGAGAGQRRVPHVAGQEEVCHWYGCGGAWGRCVPFPTALRGGCRVLCPSTVTSGYPEAVPRGAQGPVPALWGAKAGEGSLPCCLGGALGSPLCSPWPWGPEVPFPGCTESLPHSSGCTGSLFRGAWGPCPAPHGLRLPEVPSQAAQDPFPAPHDPEVYEVPSLPPPRTLGSAQPGEGVVPGCHAAVPLLCAHPGSSSSPFSSAGIYLAGS